jgi:hypothetical protein
MPPINFTKNTRSPSRLHLLQLAAELRNKIFEYAFHEQHIVVRRLSNNKICLIFQPHDYPASHRYPLSDMFAKTRLCCQICAETAILPVRLNRFQMHHIDNIGIS